MTTSIRWLLAMAGLLTFAILGRGVGEFLVGQAAVTISIDESNAGRDAANTANLMAVFVGREGCVYSKRDAVRRAWNRAASAVRTEASQRGINALTIGVAVDRDPSEGVAFLSNFGEFDEMVAGRGWRRAGVGVELNNLLAVRDRDPATPQLLFIERRGSSEVGGGTLETRLRLVGEDEIARWLLTDGRVPDLLLIEEGVES